MRFLITNDDGYDAPGLWALRSALSKLGEIDVVAPSVCHSSKGHGVTGYEPITVRRVSVDGHGQAWSVEGTPADCTRLGILELATQPPDVVVAGINPGANLGVDVYYSGTVAAAREAIFLGTPAIAISQYVKRGFPLDWQWTEKLAEATLRHILKTPVSPGCLWNINLPAVEPGCRPKSLTFAPASTDPQDVQFQRDGQDDANTRQFRFRGRYPDRSARTGTDIQLVFDGHAVATLVQIQTTAPATITVRSEPFPGQEN